MAGLIRRRAPATERAPEVALRLAVLLQAGITPNDAWRYLAQAGEDDARRVCARVAAGDSIPDAAAALGDQWRPIAAAWQLANEVGAPLSESLRAIATAMRDAGEQRDDVRIALAEPAATARLLTWLPLVAVLMGATLGFDTVGTLVATPIGIVCVLIGGCLIYVSRFWSGRLVRRAAPDPGIPGLGAELLAIALSAGVSLDRARRLVDEGPAGAQQDLRASERAETDRILDLSRSAGAPAVELLRAAAAFARLRERTAGRLRATRLSSALLLPLGVCILPAFLVLGVVPMLMSVLGDSGFSL